MNNITIKDIESAKDTLKKADFHFRKGTYGKAETLYIKLLKSNLYVKRAIYSMIAMHAKKKDYSNLLRYLEAKKELLTDKEYYRLKTYFNVKMDIESKIENHRTVLGHIIRRHKQDFYADIDIESLYYQILEQVESTEEITGDVIIYYVHCNIPIARIKREETNCVAVVSFLEKTNIITMFPIKEKVDAIKLNQKVKKLQ